MKRILLLATVVVLICPLHASATDTPAPAAARVALSPDEKKELMKAKTDALAADPALAAEQKDLKDKIKAAKTTGGALSPDLVAQKEASDQKLHAAMIKADPNVAPIIEKMKPAAK